MFCVTCADHRLEHMVTQFAKSLPPKLFIHAKQLKILESVGQGTHTHTHTHTYHIMGCIVMLCVICCVGEYGIVYKAHLTRGGLPRLVAVKTVKGDTHTLTLSGTHLHTHTHTITHPPSPSPHTLYPSLSVVYTYTLPPSLPPLSRILQHYLH